MAADDFIMTMESDTEDQPVVQTTKTARKKKLVDAEEEAQLDPAFSFDLSVYPYEGLDQTNVTDYVKAGSKPVSLSLQLLFRLGWFTWRLHIDAYFRG